MNFKVKNETELTTTRMETLVDGIFAIAMTVLVLDLKAPPSLTDLTSTQLASYMAVLGDDFINYVVSFILLANFWVAHHKQFHHIRCTDIRHLWINLAFVMFVGLVPFTTSLISRVADLWVADIIFHLNIFILSLLAALNWWYATWHFRLVDANIDVARVEDGAMRSAVMPVLCLLALAVSPLFKGNSNYIYLLVPFAMRLAPRCRKIFFRKR
ncbi:MAG: TMEM175 family protein [Synergistota bacterium]|nr:TMEM175 family protein [Synergistota bacterium]